MGVDWVGGWIIVLASEIFQVTEVADRSHYHYFRKMYYNCYCVIHKLY